MIIKEIHSIILDKMNHLGSNFKQDVTAHKAMRALDQAQRFWYDERLKVQEITKTVQRELQSFLVTEEVSGDQKSGYISVELPENYYHHSLVLLKPTGCNNIFPSTLKEQSNIGTLLQTDTTKPSLAWEQSFCVIASNKLDVYIDFVPEWVKFSYYRKLVTPDLETQYKHLDGTATTDVTLDMEGSSVYEIIEIACLILSGNFDDQFKVQFRNKLIKEYK